MSAPYPEDKREYVHHQQPHLQQQPQEQQQWAERRQPPTCCKNCGGPITYERDMCQLVFLIICCGICALCCLPKREAICVQCGLNQGYSLD